MRFAILSDLHIDLSDPAAPVAKYATRSGEQQNRVLRGLLRAVESQRPDVLVLAGDISNEYRTTLEALEYLRGQAGVPCLFVPGNHDLWNEERDPEEEGACGSSGPPPRPGPEPWAPCSATRRCRPSPRT